VEESRRAGASGLTRLTLSLRGEIVMGKNDKQSAPPKPEDKPKKPPPPSDTDDDVEDGDIATPMRDRDGTDDEPL
jgi:hypothetical protein